MDSLNLELMRVFCDSFRASHDQLTILSACPRNWVPLITSITRFVKFPQSSARLPSCLHTYLTARVSKLFEPISYVKRFTYWRKQMDIIQYMTD